MDCTNPCLTCTDISISGCLSCIEGYTLGEGSCTEDIIPVVCDASCLTCTDSSSSSCLSCYDGYTLGEG